MEPRDTQQEDLTGLGVGLNQDRHPWPRSIRAEISTGIFPS